MMDTSKEYETNKLWSPEFRWLRFVDQTVFVRSAIVAAVVGRILTSINQSGWVVGRDPLQLLPLMLVFLLPFAVVIGLIFGSLNAIITLADAFLGTGDFTAVSVVPLGQAYALPMLFGLLSQTI
jgi:hypothetical protein